MMINYYVLTELAKQRQNAFLAQAEADRLARSARRHGQTPGGAGWSPRLWVRRLGGHVTRRVTATRPAA
jgi:hypothetical protein